MEQETTVISIRPEWKSWVLLSQIRERDPDSLTGICARAIEAGLKVKDWTTNREGLRNMRRVEVGPIPSLCQFRLRGEDEVAKYKQMREDMAVSLSAGLEKPIERLKASFSLALMLYNYNNVLKKNELAVGVQADETGDGLDGPTIVATIVEWIMRGEQEPLDEIKRVITRWKEIKGNV